MNRGGCDGGWTWSIIRNTSNMMFPTNTELCYSHFVLSSPCDIWMSRCLGISYFQESPFLLPNWKPHYNRPWSWKYLSDSPISHELCIFEQMIANICLLWMGMFDQNFLHLAAACADVRWCPISGNDLSYKKSGELYYL